MPLLTEIAATVGFSVEDESKFDLDKFREHLSKTYTPTETILKDETIRKKIVGKVLGSLATKAAQEFELRSSEVDGKPLEEIFSLVRKKYSGIITALSDKSGDEKVQELEVLLNTRDENIRNLEKKYSNDSKKWEENLKSYKLNDKLNKARQAIQHRLTDDYHKNELVRSGFDAHIDNAYLFELADNDEVLVKNRTNGELIKSKLNAGQTATPEEIILAAAEAKGVLKKNNATTGQVKTIGKKSLKNDSIEKEVLIHPNALKRVQKP